MLMILFVLLQLFIEHVEFICQVEYNASS